jgi:hypothetical protein
MYLISGLSFVEESLNCCKRNLFHRPARERAAPELPVLDENPPLHRPGQGRNRRRAGDPAAADDGAGGDGPPGGGPRSGLSSGHARAREDGAWWPALLRPLVKGGTFEALTAVSASFRRREMRRPRCSRYQGR